MTALALAITASYSNWIGRSHGRQRQPRALHRESRRRRRRFFAAPRFSFHFSSKLSSIFAFVFFSPSFARAILVLITPPSRAIGLQKTKLTAIYFGSAFLRDESARVGRLIQPIEIELIDGTKGMRMENGAMKPSHRCPRLFPGKHSWPIPRCRAAWTGARSSAPSVEENDVTVFQSTCSTAHCHDEANSHSTMGSHSLSS